MSIPVDAGTVGLLMTLFLALASFQIGFIKWMLDRNQTHLDQRFTHIEQRFVHLDKENKASHEQWQNVERELLKLKALLPVEYVRREDWLRFGSALEAKLDLMSYKIDEMRKDNGHGEGPA